MFYALHLALFANAARRSAKRMLDETLGIMLLLCTVMSCQWSVRTVSLLLSLCAHIIIETRVQTPAFRVPVVIQRVCCSQTEAELGS